MEAIIEAIRPYLELGLGGTAVVLLYQFKGEVRAGFEAVGRRLDKQDEEIADLRKRILSNVPQNAL